MNFRIPALLLKVILFVLAAYASQGAVQLTTLVSFNGTNGAQPQARLVQGKDGNFYGTTEIGGRRLHQVSDNGTVFKMVPNGTLVWSFAFGGTNGAHPMAELLEGKDGCFYGTTFGGGIYTNGWGSRLNETVFKITPHGRFVWSVSFDGANGLNSEAGL